MWTNLWDSLLVHKLEAANVSHTDWRRRRLGKSWWQRLWHENWWFENDHWVNVFEMKEGLYFGNFHPFFGWKFKASGSGENGDVKKMLMIYGDKEPMVFLAGEIVGRSSLSR
ncbi:hypothetical protein LIER_01131 [Lithospermum erythrorhizon]|uniref:Uncharacterized protein n=1 Tax=Lithospermum erythrorhizon TaxID=34254 RepID=A0AAV3NPD7_LITER